MENKNCKAEGGCGCKSENKTSSCGRSESKTSNCKNMHKASEGGNGKTLGCGKSQTKATKSQSTPKSGLDKTTSCK